MLYFKLSECFKISNLKAVSVEIMNNYPQLWTEFVQILNYRDSKRYVAFMLENSKIFIEKNIAVTQSDAYPAIILLKNINYFAIEEAILSQPDLLEGISESDMIYLIGEDNWISPKMLKNIDLKALFDEYKQQGCTDIKAVIKAI